MPADSQAAWVGAHLTVRMTVGAGGKENSVAVPHPLPLLRPHPPAAGWPAAAVGGQVVGTSLGAETETETGTGGESAP